MKFTPVPKPVPTAKKRRRPMRQRSEKAERVRLGISMAGEGRLALVERLLLEHPLCQMGDRIQALTIGDKTMRPHCCERLSVEVHEVLRRSAGGSITDEENCLATCRACHRFVHTHPLAARGLGLLKSRYAGA